MVRTLIEANHTLKKSGTAQLVKKNSQALELT